MWVTFHWLSSSAREIHQTTVQCSTVQYSTKGFGTSRTSQTGQRRQVTTAHTQDGDRRCPPTPVPPVLASHKHLSYPPLTTTLPNSFSCVVFLILFCRLGITESTLSALINRSKPQCVLHSVSTGLWTPSTKTLRKMIQLNACEAIYRVWP